MHQDWVFLHRLSMDCYLDLNLQRDWSIPNNYTGAAVHVYICIPALVFVVNRKTVCISASFQSLPAHLLYLSYYY